MSGLLFNFPSRFLCLVRFTGISLCLLSPSAQAAQPSSFPKTQTPALNQVQRVLVQTIALTERGRQDPTALQQSVIQRLEEAGFESVSSPKAPHHVTVRVKCEERKTWTGPSKHRSSNHRLRATSRLWKGPACHISYRYQGHTPTWSWEIHTSFEQPEQAAKAAGAKNSGTFALEELNTQLRQDEFPLYLAAEWGQSGRLITLFHQTTDNLNRRRLILELLGPLNSPDALSTIEEATKSPELAVTAIAALGDQGEVAIPSVVNILDSSESSEHRLVALQALGEIATHSTPPTLFDVFVKQLQSQDPRMQTIAVRGLGSLGDLRALASIEELNIEAWSNPSTHANMQALREALNWALYQLDASSSSH